MGKGQNANREENRSESKLGNRQRNSGAENRLDNRTENRTENRLRRYRTVYEGGTGEIVEKKSRFIAQTAHVESEAEALAFIEGIRKEYWDARHHCYAFNIGLGQETARCSDDVEPAQTAGKPMLDVLLGQELKNTVVVVTRYFGGTLLGTGGLVRAYSAAAQEGLVKSLIIEKFLCQRVHLRVDYTLLGKLQYLAGRMSLPVLDTVYTEMAELQLLVPAEDLGAFEKEVTEATGGKAVPEKKGWIYGADINGTAQIFES